MPALIYLALVDHASLLGLTLTFAALYLVFSLLTSLLAFSLYSRRFPYGAA